MKQLVFLLLLVFSFSSCETLKNWNAERKEIVAEKKVNKAVVKSRVGAAKGCSKQFPIKPEIIYKPGETKTILKVVKDSVRFNVDSLLATLPKGVEYITLPCKPDTTFLQVDTNLIVKESTAKLEAMQGDYEKKLNAEMRYSKAVLDSYNKISKDYEKAKAKLAKSRSHNRWYAIRFWGLVSLLGVGSIIFLYLKLKPNIKLW